MELERIQKAIKVLMGEDICVLEKDRINVLSNDLTTCLESAAEDTGKGNLIVQNAFQTIHMLEESIAEVTQNKIIFEEDLAEALYEIATLDFAVKEFQVNSTDFISKIRDLNDELESSEAECQELINDNQVLLDNLSSITLDFRNLDEILNPPFHPTDCMVLSRGELGRILTLNYPDFAQELLDTEYLIPSLEETLIILSYWERYKKEYLKNRRDCDNFGFGLNSYGSFTFGVNHFLPLWDYDAVHVYDLAMVISPEDSTPRIIEPQTIKIWKNIADDPSTLHPMLRGKIFGF